MLDPDTVPDIWNELFIFESLKSGVVAKRSIGPSVGSFAARNIAP